MAQTNIATSLSGVRSAMIMLVIIGSTSAFVARKLPSRREFRDTSDARAAQIA